jgi:hypothetical protein
MIDRGADGLGIASIIEWGRHGVVVQGEFHHQLVELGGGHAGANMRRYQIERFGAQPPRPAHGVEALRSMQLDLPGVGNGRDGGIDIGHKA